VYKKIMLLLLRPRGKRLALDRAKIGQANVEEVCHKH